VFAQVLRLAAGPVEPLRPLAAVASGGEAARIMLALKAAPTGGVEGGAPKSVRTEAVGADVGFKNGGMTRGELEVGGEVEAEGPAPDAEVAVRGSMQMDGSVEGSVEGLERVGDEVGSGENVHIPKLTRRGNVGSSRETCRDLRASSSSSSSSRGGGGSSGSRLPTSSSSRGGGAGMNTAQGHIQFGGGFDGAAEQGGKVGSGGMPGAHTSVYKEEGSSNGPPHRVLHPPSSRHADGHEPQLLHSVTGSEADSLSPHDHPLQQQQQQQQQQPHVPILVGSAKQTQACDSCHVADGSDA